MHNVKLWKEMKAKKVFLILAGGAILFLLGSQDRAYCLNVSLGRIEITVNADSIYDTDIIVTNNESRSLEIKLRIEDWLKAVEGNPKGASGEFKWLKISPLQFELKEDMSQRVSLKIEVPRGAKGEFNAMIFIEGKPKEVAKGPISINTSIGIPVYVAVNGTQEFKAGVEDLQVMASDPLKLTVKIKNSGNVHIRPEGTIEIRNADLRGSGADKRGFVVPLNEYNYPILPNSSRTLEIRSNKRLERGEYVADIEMGYADKKYKKRLTLKVQ